MPIINVVPEEISGNSIAGLAMAGLPRGRNTDGSVLTALNRSSWTTIGPVALLLPLTTLYHVCNRM